MASLSLARSSIASASRVGSCSSSVLSTRSLSSSKPDLVKNKQKMVAKVRGPPEKKREGPRNRRRHTIYQFDKTVMPGYNPEPISFAHFPRFPPNSRTDDEGWRHFTRAESVGKVHINRNSKEIQYWGPLTNQNKDVAPMTVPRQLTFDLMERIDAIRTCPPQELPEKHANIMLWGNSGTGKTHLIAQLHAFANERRFITLLIPSAIRHVSWASSYHYSEKTKTFHQPTMACFLLEKMNGSVNEELFTDLPIDEVLTFTPDVAPGIGGSRKQADLVFKGHNIAELCKFGANHPAISTEVLEMVVERIRTQKQFPVMISIDHAQAYFRISNYLTPELNKLEPYHLSVPRMFLDIISGRKPIHRGLTLLAASPLDTHFRVSPELLHGLGLPTNEHVLGEYFTFNRNNYPMDPNKELQPSHVENARELELVRLPEGFTLEEARGLWEAKVVRRTMHTVNSDDNFLAKYIEVQGNPRAFFRAIDYSTA